MSLLIETARLRMTEVGAADGEFLLRLMNEPAYLRHIGDRGVRTAEDARAYIEARFAASYGRFGYGLYRVERKDAPGAIGICGFVRRDSLLHADLGFAFLEQHWSQGFALEACRGALGHGFGALGMTTVLAVASAANAASIRLLERLGFRYEKLVHLPPSGAESMLFTLERPPPA
jgi:RimJ/RimL family protein N-acetyltransferase